MGIKEMILALKMSTERLAEEMKENSSSRRKEKSSTSDGTNYKMKRKMEDVKAMNNPGGGLNGRSKYKLVEMLIFTEENPEAWVYRAKHYFK